MSSSSPRTNLYWRALLTVAAIFSLAAVACEVPPSSTSTATRTMMGDTLVVTTDLESNPGPSLFTVTLDLSIGEMDGPEEYVLLAPNSVSADGAGRIYVSDQREGEVRIYSPEGQFLHGFGRRGDGPGEFNSSSWGWFQVRPVAGGRITVEDLPRSGRCWWRGGPPTFPMEGMGSPSSSWMNPSRSSGSFRCGKCRKDPTG